MLLDRMVNLLSRGCVLPVMKYIKNCYTKGDTDISLIRYFVREVSRQHIPQAAILSLPFQYHDAFVDVGCQR